MQLETESSTAYTNLEFTNEISERLSDYIKREVRLDLPFQSANDSRMNLLHSNERNYAKYLISKGIIVFHEPEISGVIKVPDFFVWKPNTSLGDTLYSGTFIELTLCSRDELFSKTKFCRRKYARKKRQIEVFEKIGIPIMYVCKEDQEDIQKVSDFRKN